MMEAAKVDGATHYDIFTKIMFVPNFSTLVEGFGDFWPQIRILRVEISLEPDSEVWKPKICFENDKNKFWKKNPIMGLIIWSNP